MKKLAVYCGSSRGIDEIFGLEAQKLGEKMAEKDLGLVYGGAKVGLMGAVADGVLSKGGEVIGILPHFLRSEENAHRGITELIMVETMHERKMMMAEMCDGVITLPGGFGTLEELSEMFTWRKLNLHRKPIGILNIGGFYDDLLNLVDKMIEKGFMKAKFKDLLIVSEDIDDLLELMQNENA